MYLVLVLIASVAGTACMSFYMFLVSLFSGKEYRVPFVLGSMFSVHKSTDNLLDYSMRSRVLGTVVHYMVGALFAMAYLWVWKHGWLDISAPSALALGVFSGVAGVGVWRAFFQVHPFSVRMNLLKYLVHLFLAHLVFAGVVTLAFFLMTNKAQLNGEPYDRPEMVSACSP